MTKADYAYSAIREQILSGELVPGEAIDQESLAATLGVSTTPLREALRRLQSERLVVSRAHRDTVVAPLEFESLEEICIVRLQVEPLGTRLATMKASDSALDDIAKYVDRGPSEDDPVSLMRYNGSIHRWIYRSSSNETLIGILDSLSDLMDRYRVVTLRADPDIELDQRNHAEIIQAMVDRNADRAERLMREHVAFGLQRMRSIQENASSS
jgi:DNA-binding GntR family transcriptional regulator